MGLAMTNLHMYMSTFTIFFSFLRNTETFTDITEPFSGNFQPPSSLWLNDLWMATYTIYSNWEDFCVLHTNFFTMCVLSSWGHIFSLVKQGTN